MLTFLATSCESVAEPVLCLLKDTREQWLDGAYGRENVKALEPELLRRGEVLLYDVDGVAFAIPQYDLVDEFNGKTIDDDGQRLIVFPTRNGEGA